MRGASIIVPAMSGAGAGAVSGTNSVLEVDTIAEVVFASVLGTQVGAVSVGKSSDGKVWCNLFKDVDKCDRLNCDRFKCDRFRMLEWSILGRCNPVWRIIPCSENGKVAYQPVLRACNLLAD